MCILDSSFFVFTTKFPNSIRNLSGLYPSPVTHKKNNKDIVESESVQFHTVAAVSLRKRDFSPYFFSNPRKRILEKGRKQRWHPYTNFSPRLNP